jgi:hypothetical protein
MFFGTRTVIPATINQSKHSSFSQKFSSKLSALWPGKFRRIAAEFAVISLKK